MGVGCITCISRLPRVAALYCCGASASAERPLLYALYMVVVGGGGVMSRSWISRDRFCRGFR
jgi:hypothetical protein